MGTYMSPKCPPPPRETHVVLVGVNIKLILDPIYSTKQKILSKVFYKYYI